MRNKDRVQFIENERGFSLLLVNDIEIPHVIEYNIKPIDRTGKLKTIDIKLRIITSDVEYIKTP